MYVCFKHYTQKALEKFKFDSEFDEVSNINKKSMFSSDIQKSEVINFQTFLEKLRKSKQLENLINIWGIKPNTESTDLSKMVIDVIEKKCIDSFIGGKKSHIGWTPFADLAELNTDNQSVIDNYLKPKFNYVSQLIAPAIFVLAPYFYTILYHQLKELTRYPIKIPDKDTILRTSEYLKENEIDMDHLVARPITYELIKNSTKDLSISHFNDENKLPKIIFQALKKHTEGIAYSEIDGYTQRESMHGGDSVSEDLNEICWNCGKKPFFWNKIEIIDSNFFEKKPKVDKDTKYLFKFKSPPGLSPSKSKVKFLCCPQCISELNKTYLSSSIENVPSYGLTDSRFELSIKPDERYEKIKKIYELFQQNIDSDSSGLKEYIKRMVHEYLTGITQKYKDYPTFLKINAKFGIFDNETSNKEKPHLINKDNSNIPDSNAICCYVASNLFNTWDINNTLIGGYSQGGEPEELLRQTEKEKEEKRVAKLPITESTQQPYIPNKSKPEEYHYLLGKKVRYDGSNNDKDKIIENLTNSLKELCSIPYSFMKCQKKLTEINNKQFKKLCEFQKNTTFFSMTGGEFDDCYEKLEKIQNVLRDIIDKESTFDTTAISSKSSLSESKNNSGNKSFYVNSLKTDNVLWLDEDMVDNYSESITYKDIESFISNNNSIISTSENPVTHSKSQLYDRLQSQNSGKVSLNKGINIQDMHHHMR